MFRLEFRERARKRLSKIARHDPQTAKDAHAKIMWLVENAYEVAHERMKGYDEYSLHIGQYRILYSLDWGNELIIIEDIDKHNAAYRRLKRR